MENCGKKNNKIGDKKIKPDYEIIKSIQLIKKYEYALINCFIDYIKIVKEIYYCVYICFEYIWIQFIFCIQLFIKNSFIRDYDLGDCDNEIIYTYYRFITLIYFLASINI